VHFNACCVDVGLKASFAQESLLRVTPVWPSLQQEPRILKKMCFSYCMTMAGQSKWGTIIGQKFAPCLFFLLLIFHDAHSAGVLNLLNALVPYIHYARKVRVHLNQLHFIWGTRI
jgi:hypothetical protein